MSLDVKMLILCNILMTLYAFGFTDAGTVLHTQVSFDLYMLVLRYKYS